MAESWPSGIIKGQKLEGWFSIDTGGKLGVNGRALSTFFMRYPDGATYKVDSGCNFPIGDVRNAPNTRKGSQIIEDAMALMRDKDFAGKESARLNRNAPDATRITPEMISEFAKKLEDNQCRFGAAPPKPHAPNTFASRSIKNRGPLTTATL